MKIKKRILISILLILIILSTNIAVTLAATKSELQNKQNNINQQIKDTENEISAVKEEMSDTMKQIQDLNTQISGYQSEIDDLEYKISDLEKDIEESQEKLKEAEKNYNKQEEVRKTELDKIRAELDTEESTHKDFLNAIIDFISFSESTDSNIEDRENISKNDYRYYVTPDRLNAYITLANVISKWKVSNSFNPNRKLSYTDILSIIYNTPEGIEKIDDIYKSLWRALKAASDIDSIFLPV